MFLTALPLEQPSVATTIAVSAVNLTKTYGTGARSVRAVDGISLVIPRGTFTAIMGPSGSGKSTLMHCLAGLDSVTSGRIFLGGHEISQLRDAELTKLRRDRVGFVFQSFNLLPTLTARQNILLPLDLAGRRVDDQRLQSVVASLGLTDRLQHRPSELSGGQQQRVAIARALITEPDVIFADEPTGALDSVNGQALLAQLRMASRELGQTIVMVTHDAAAAAYADRALLINDGQLVGDLDHPDADSIRVELSQVGA
ncbi:putative ABC transporter ATP-binding protein [Microlunatus phosphovorus NM-1]|uniref:Putative ABC transporter ATP-binding protein n=1 Tax=Microlunatus phosphovorus (strain ATCC 700054 / DSM 10555 / JCM 9379 / NBRC 101784 / NCIMB 13414 / VKM Ac-1990 / NM-1) TaxID=1032480 RepID=F5XQW4_MICPN|nr:putative ABC transporter ATP-binding protein [Microlunatus phosphovorus NM-1]